jgi:hypothetical protein
MVLHPIVAAHYYNQPTIISIQDSRIQAIPLYSQQSLRCNRFIMGKLYPDKVGPSK